MTNKPSIARKLRQFKRGNGSNGAPVLFQSKKSKKVVQMLLTFIARMCYNIRK